MQKSDIKHFDTANGEKLALEDMCQLTEKLTEDKYRGSMEMVGKQIRRFSSRPGLDVVRLFEMTLFCFITGNADMHLKNFALLTTAEKEIILSPAYDMLCTRIAMPSDKEEVALTVNAKKRKLKKSDFVILAKNLNIPEKTVQNTYFRIAKKTKEAKEWIDISFLPRKIKQQYKKIIDENIKKLQ